MAQHSHRSAGDLPPAVKALSPTVPLHGGDKAGDILPFPIGDTPGRPYIRPHRLAQVMRDERACSDFTDVDEETRKAAEELIGRIFRLVCVIGFTTLAVCVLFYLSTGYIRGVFQ